ncbi:platelet factor 4 [Acomys russatus]|uniref:platelet factor 4 n=1 Tax=Acomys russatus TaxID=60746 RepID=UPI0021E26A48|nr:platelet factor 4 [Acomys russatus]
MSALAMFRGLRPSPQLLFLGLLFLPAVVAMTSASPEESDGDLSCICVKTISSGIHPKHFTSLEVIRAGRHCAVPQLIATLKNGRKICLDPQASLYKKVVKKLLKS